MKSPTDNCNKIHFTCAHLPKAHTKTYQKSPKIQVVEHAVPNLHKYKMVAYAGDEISELVKSCLKPYQCIPLVIRVQKRYSLTYLRCTVLEL